MKSLIEQYYEIREKIGNPSPKLSKDSYKGDIIYLMEGYTRKIFPDTLIKWIEVLEFKYINKLKGEIIA